MGVSNAQYCHCGRIAAYVDSVPDARLPGAHPSECGYREQPLCVVHGMERKRVATSRVRPLNREVTCDTCGKTWEDNYPNHPGDVIWCGECDRAAIYKTKLETLEAKLIERANDGTITAQVELMRVSV